MVRRPGARGRGAADARPGPPHGGQHRRSAARGRGRRPHLREAQPGRQRRRGDSLRGGDGLAGAPDRRRPTLGRARYRRGAVRRGFTPPGRAAIARRNRRQSPRRVRQGLRLSGRARKARSQGEARGRGDSPRRNARRGDVQPHRRNGAGRVRDHRGARSPGQRVRDHGDDGCPGKPRAEPLRTLGTRGRRAYSPAPLAKRRRILGRDSPHRRRGQGIARTLDSSRAGFDAGGLRRDPWRGRVPEGRSAGRRRNHGAFGARDRGPASRPAPDLPVASDRREDGHRDRALRRPATGGHDRHRPVSDDRAHSLPGGARAQSSSLERTVAAGPNRFSGLPAGLRDRRRPPVRATGSRPGSAPPGSRRPSARAPFPDRPRGDAQEELVLRHFPHR